jgi:redox-sensitive bicupin YhaK (pirin superfamily)
VVKGTIEVNGERLTTGDAAAFTPDEHVELTSSDASEVLLFDLA